MNKARSYGTFTKFAEAVKNLAPVPNLPFYINETGTKIIELISKENDDYVWLEKTINPGKSLSSQGYHLVHTRWGIQLVHRLVAMAYLNPTFEQLNYMEVDHLDGNKENNDFRNLRFVTHSENMKAAWKNGLVSKPKYEFRYSRKNECLIFSDKTRLKMSPKEYIAWRIDHNLPLKGWMIEYVDKAKSLLEVDGRIKIRN